MTAKATSTNYKALQVNLESNMYGTFAEIGAGQEVARFFFQAGGASQTIAKSMSAYDMTFSDAIYGREASGRYVCQSRLEKMLDYEFNLINERLRDKRGENTRFFVLANTAATKTHFSNNDGHCWVGIIFQAEPLGPTHKIVAHLRLIDNHILAQQEAIGIFGVNLVHAATYHFQGPFHLLDSLIDNLSNQRIELNMIELSGELYKTIDNRLLNLELVKRGLTNAVMFDGDGTVVLAADELYRKTVQVVRGSFRPPTKINLNMIECGRRNVAKDLKISVEKITTICEITMHSLGNIDEENSDFLERVDLLAALKQKVLISNFPQYYKLVNYFLDFKAEHLALVLGGYNFKQIFDNDYNQNTGGVFAALGQLFKENVRVYVYPYRDEAGQKLIDVENLEIPERLKYLLTYLKENSNLIGLKDYDDGLLHIYSRRVLNMISKNEVGWEEMVPKDVANVIKEKKFFVK